MNKNERIELVKRKFNRGKKKLVSYRISEKLIKRIKYISKKKQWTVTDLVSLSLDLFVQWEEKSIEIVPIKLKKVYEDYSPMTVFGGKIYPPTDWSK